MADIKWRSDGDTFEVLREAKSMELRNMCGEAILSGFDMESEGIVYHFSYDNEAQMNFQETYRLIEGDVIDSVMWTASLNGGKVRIPLSKSSFYEVYFKSVQHKLDTISKYRDILLPKIGQAKTVEELDLITWDCEDVKKSVELSTNNIVDKRIDSNKVTQAKGDLEILNIIMMGGM